MNYDVDLNNGIEHPTHSSVQDRSENRAGSGKNAILRAEGAIQKGLRFEQLNIPGYRDRRTGVAHIASVNRQLYITGVWNMSPSDASLRLQQRLELEQTQFRGYLNLVQRNLAESTTTKSTQDVVHHILAH